MSGFPQCRFNLIELGIEVERGGRFGIGCQEEDADLLVGHEIVSGTGM
jgi:hypothetical protein